MREVMRVLLVNTYPTGGGAAVACRRTMELLTEAGIEVRMLTATEYPLRHKLSFMVERFDTWRAEGYQRHNLFRFSTASAGLPIAQHPWVAWADVIHLHWTSQGLLSLLGLSQLLSLKGKKFFWTLHDFWPLTGGCHIPYIIAPESGETTFCQSYKSHCACCPLLSSEREQDRAYRIFETKRKLPLHKIHLIAVSQAVANAAQASPLFKESPLTLLHNPLNLSKFTPEETSQPSPHRLLMVAARIDDPVKGPDLLCDMLHKAKGYSPEFAQQAKITLVGKLKDPSLLGQIPIPVRHIERAEESQLVQLYREASLLLSTSRYETLGQTLIEGIACGTPAIAFEVGGISDIIRPESGNGLLIPPYDTSLMAKRVVKWLQHTPRERSKIAKSVAHFDQHAIAPQLLALYQ